MAPRKKSPKSTLNFYADGSFSDGSRLSWKLGSAPTFADGTPLTPAHEGAMFSPICCTLRFADGTETPLQNSVTLEHIVDATHACLKGQKGLKGLSFAGLERHGWFLISQVFEPIFVDAKKIDAPDPV